MVHGINRGHQVHNPQTTSKTPHILKAPWAGKAGAWKSSFAWPKTTWWDVEPLEFEVWLSSPLGHRPNFSLACHTALARSRLLAESKGMLLLLWRGLSQRMLSALLKQINFSLREVKLQPHFFTGSFPQAHTSLNLELPFHPAVTFLKLTTSASFPLLQNLQMQPKVKGVLIESTISKTLQVLLNSHHPAHKLSPFYR